MTTNNIKVEIAKVLEAKKEITARHNFDNDRDEWYLNGKRTNKRNAANILKKYGLTLDTYRVALNAWIAQEVERAAKEMILSGELKIDNAK